MHGIPDDAPLFVGDIVNCDVSTYIDGHYGDTSKMYFLHEKPLHELLMVLDADEMHEGYGPQGRSSRLADFSSVDDVDLTGTSPGSSPSGAD